MSSPFTFYVMQSAHTDLGFTHPQQLIAQRYLDYYDQVLMLCKQTAHAPEAQRFKWTCETAWQVHHYLTARPEREEAFLYYVRHGQIEMVANYYHFTDMIDADAYQRSLAWAVDYCSRHHLPLRCALHSDVNGWPWAVADILAEYHIPFFCSQVNMDSATDPLGQRGSSHYMWQLEAETKELLRLDAPFRVPQAFWWQGPEGGRVLHWLGEHYLFGNLLGISTPYGLSSAFREIGVATVDDMYRIAQHEIPLYLERLRDAGYPYNMLLVSTGGYFTDNAPPDSRWLEIISRWNAHQEDIQLRSATLGEWFDALWTHAAEHQVLPIYQVAWPDAWAHGLGSATARVAQERRTQRRRADALTLVEQAQSQKAVTNLHKALEQEFIALEHTFGAWSSTGLPASPENHFQQITKELSFHCAEMYLDEAIRESLQTLFQAATPPYLYVPFTSANKTKPVAPPLYRTVHFNGRELHLDPAVHALSSEDGQPIAFQLDHPELRQCVAVVHSPQEEVARFGVMTQYTEEKPFSPSLRAPDLYQLETAAWHLEIDAATGGLRSLRDRTSDREWLTSHQYAFGQLVHEVVIHPLGRKAVGNIARLIALGVANDATRHGFAEQPIVEHSVLTIEGTPQYTSGPVFDAFTLYGSAEHIGRVRIAWRAYHTLPLVELVFDWDKVWSDAPEAAYVAFPFAAQDGSLAFETGGGFFHPGSHDRGGQLPGTCSNYYTIQRAARVVNKEDARLLWLPIDAPLVMTNDINFNNWETTPWIWNGFLASMPVNHYWHTNFPVSQRGPLRLRYRMLLPDSFLQEEQAIQAAMPVEALGWL